MDEKTFLTLRHYIILLTIMISVVVEETEGIEYSWLEHNDIYDCVVGISVDNKPVTMGMILKANLIITSANPIERINDTNRIKIHTIDGHFKKSKVHAVHLVTRDQGKRLTGSQWRTFGFDNRHAPHHDLIIISPREEFKFDAGPRLPSVCSSGYHGGFRLDGKFSYVGFGFIDRPHVKQNVELELVEYEYEEVFTECSEWVPKIWGNFICLKNIEHFVGVSSGAGLFYNGGFVGVGSFGVKRGNEGILLFTDFLKYVPKLHYFINPPKG